MHSKGLKFRSCSRLVLLACLGCFSLPALAQDAIATPTPTAEPAETVVAIVERRTIDTTHPGNSQTIVPATTIERNPTFPTLNNIIADSVPGAASLPDGAIRIRGSDNQFSYYLDGAPLPANVSSFITDQFNPKNIESLHVITGAFPAQYNGQLSAVFDIRAKGGKAGEPEGYLQATGGNFSTRDGVFQYSDGVGKLGYFVSGLRSDTDFRLSPRTIDPRHNYGRENVVFSKFDYRLTPRDQLTFHLGGQNATLGVPNSPDRQAVGQDDEQIERRGYFNAIWRRDDEKNNWTVSLYSHSSQNRYKGSPGDLVASAEDEDDDDALISVNQRQTIRYTGARGDFSLSRGANHKIGTGFEVRQGHGDLDFSLVSPPTDGFDPVVDARNLRSTDLGFYLQDDWKLGRFNLNYGARYDHNSANQNGSYSQISPRLNLSYTAGSNTYYAFYNRLWMPVPVESIRRFEGESALGDLNLRKVQPETDDYYGLGWKGRQGKNTFTVDAYYKAVKNIVDNQEIGNTLLEVPINESQGIVRGIELSLDQPISRNFSFTSTYGLSRGTAAGPVTGGLLGLEGLPSGFFIDDKDVTHIASASLDYSGQKTYAQLNAQFASGFPFGEEEDANGDPLRINFNRAASRFLLNLGVGHHITKKFELALNVNNLLDNKYVIAQDSVFRRSIFGQRRAYAVKATWNF